ncbi:ABC transporter permease [Fundicoccus culcitae]|uniref:ABC transporter permease n=1 Tax=Fundicoccus culcitae TaxID=2969821 RepID=A0ABY5P558_9LACT|nr:ABC transporter permease [Fundicoccus culcitae]UUX33878.1 ABC transporter permease [Fundicoccus culcitae]
MKNINTQININVKRLLLRNKRSVIFTLIFPLFFYVLYTSIFTFPMTDEMMIAWQKDYLISMLVYGVLMTSIITVGNALLVDHMNHFDLFVELSPTPKWQYVLTVVLVYIPFYILLMVLLGITALIVNQVTLTPIQWLGTIVINLLGMIPFGLIGVLVSYGGTPTVVNIVGNLLTFPLAILGGLWWPLDYMPGFLQTIGKGLVTYQIAELNRQWIHDSIIAWDMVIGVVIWTILLAALIFVLQLLLKRREAQLI